MEREGEKPEDGDANAHTLGDTHGYMKDLLYALEYTLDLTFN